MFYLVLSILTSSLLVILFKVFNRYGINIFQAIVFNYLTAAFCGLLITGSVQSSTAVSGPGFWLALLLGILFISIFNVVGYTVEKTGITPVAVAQKMSLIIPVSFAVIYYHEHLGLLKITGMLMALAAIWFTSAGKEKKPGSTNKPWILLLIVFLGSGLIDALVKFAQAEYLGAGDMNRYITLMFTSAGITGLIIMIALRITGVRISGKNIVAGIALGIPNYASIYCLIKSLALPGIESSVIFPVNNMGIIMTSTLTAWLFFREKLSMLNWAGIVISLVAIFLISFN